MDLPREPGRISPPLCIVLLPLLALLALLALVLPGCERATVDPEVAEGPLPAADAPVDTALAGTGAVLFQRKCVACHAWDDRIVGPPLAGITRRRTPEWIRGMVLDPDSMLAADSAARALLETYAVPMSSLQLEEPQFRAIWEYLRARDTGGGA